MGTLTGLLGLATSALDANQVALNTTANNVANQNTAGYTVQTVSFAAGDAVTLGGGSINGSVTATVSSQRSRVLEQALQQATSVASASSSRLTALQNVQSAFGLTSTTDNASSTQLGSAIDDFFSSLQSLSANPTDTATRQAVLTAAATLASAFNAASSAITEQTTSLNSDVAASASQINGLTATVAQLNQQIAQQDPNSDAGALEDQRQQAITQLASLVGVNQITTENNGVTLTTSSGAVLVSSAQAFAVSTQSVNGLTQIVAGDPPSAQSDIEGGSIGGMIEARDQDLPGMMNALDGLANAVGTAANEQNKAGQTSSGNPGSPLFTLPPSVSGSAAQISVALASPGGIATAGAGEGVDGTANAAALAQLGGADIVDGDTASDAFGNFIGALGDTTQAATTGNSAATAAETQAQMQRDTLSAVNLNDEASQLTVYQRAYQAAAQVFDVVNQLMADALNLGQQTTVS